MPYRNILEYIVLIIFFFGTEHIPIWRSQCIRTLGDPQKWDLDSYPNTYLQKDLRSNQRSFEK